MKADFKRHLLEKIPKKKCRYCLTTENLTYDHKVPLIQGGKDDIKNIQVLCFMCNTTKSGLSNQQVWQIARWVYAVNKRREQHGKRPLSISKREYEAT